MIFPLEEPDIDDAVQQAQTIFFRPMPSPVPRISPRPMPPAELPAPRPMPAPVPPGGGRAAQTFDPVAPPPSPERDTQQEDETEPNPGPGPGNDECVGECEENRCRTLVVCFAPGANIDQTEFARQMELQEDGLNRMSPSSMLENRSAFLSDREGMRSKADLLGQEAREEFARNQRVQAEYEAQYGAMGFLALAEDISGRNSRLVALHNPDMVAGGLYSSVVDTSIPIENRIGTRSANSSLGGQWPSRAQRVEEHAERQEENGCATVQVSLRVCPSLPGSPGEPLNPGAVPPAGQPTNILPWGGSRSA